MTTSKTPRPADTYRGARRNALKAGEKLQPHRWQTRVNYLDGRFTGKIMMNASRPTYAYAKDAR